MGALGTLERFLPASLEPMVLFFFFLKKGLFLRHLQGLPPQFFAPRSYFACLKVWGRAHHLCTQKVLEVRVLWVSFFSVCGELPLPEKE